MNDTDLEGFPIPEADLRDALAHRADTAVPDLERIRKRVDHRLAGSSGLGAMRWRLPLAAAAAVAVIAVAAAVLVTTRGPNPNTPASSNGIATPTRSELLGTWRVTDYAVNGREHQATPDHEITLEFAQRTFSIGARCRWSTANTWNIDGDELDLDQLIGQDFLCADDSGKVIGSPELSNLISSFDTERIKIVSVTTDHTARTTISLTTPTASLTAEKMGVREREPAGTMSAPNTEAGSRANRSAATTDIVIVTATPNTH